MLKNEIFYSLSKYEINAIMNSISNKNNSKYLNLIITFSKAELNSIYKLLSNIYLHPSHNNLENEIWETFICNKILQELEKNELIYYKHNVIAESKILKSYDINRFIHIKGNRSNISLLSKIIKNQVTKNIIIHYFQDDIIIPIELQKIINRILTSKLPFTNILYTTRNSINSYFMDIGYWVKRENEYIEIWDLLPTITKKAN